MKRQRFSLYSETMDFNALSSCWGFQSIENEVPSSFSKKTGLKDRDSIYKRGRAS